MPNSCAPRTDRYMNVIRSSCEGYHLTLDAVVVWPMERKHCNIGLRYSRENLPAVFVWSKDTVQHLIKVMDAFVVERLCVNCALYD